VVIPPGGGITTSQGGLAPALLDLVTSGPLDGIQVLELASFVSGPLAGMMLADLGATVTKVEHPKGDPFRQFGRPTRRYSAVFANTNRNKSSLVLDLKSHAGRVRLLELATDADVLISNWRPAVAERLGLADDVVARGNPRLIRAYVTGFGPTGPYADQPVYDGIVQALSGMAALQGSGDAPRIAAIYQVDKIAASTAAQAILAALVARSRTGQGDSIEIAMLDAAAYFTFPDAMAGRTFLSDPPGNDVVPARPLRTADGWIAVVPVTARQFRNCCAAVDHPEWGAELLAIPDALALTDRLFDRLETVTRAEATSHWLERFARADVPAARCLSLDEHLEDPQVLHNLLYPVVEVPGLGRVRTVRHPAVFGSYGELGFREPAPDVGE
jgi:CoA:oxalate CoA-transferase